MANDVHRHGATAQLRRERSGLLLMALACLALCSCRVAARAPSREQCLKTQKISNPSLPGTMYGPHAMCAAGLDRAGLALAGRPYPRDEYLCDGGDIGYGAMISPEWQTRGVDVTDTIAHYDTLDGRTLVEPSNRVCVYAPRFGAVRVVSRTGDAKGYDPPQGVAMTNTPVVAKENLPPGAATQRTPPGRQDGLRSPSDYHTRQIEGLIADSVKLRGTQDKLLPFEDFKLVSAGIFDAAEKARLAKSVDAAIQWTHDLGVGVLLEGQAAMPLVKETPLQTVYVVEDLTHPKLRLVKLASAPAAHPGDEIDFTIRFDNVGDALIGNIVIIDNLTTRLEYVEGSAQSSLPASFASERNEAGSLSLRWEINDPLDAGQGGIVRFKCRVR